MTRGNQYQDEDSGVLLYHNPETRETEILIDEHRRNQSAVQTSVMRLLGEHVRSSTRFVSRSVLQNCRKAVVLNGRTVATVGHGVTGRSVVAEVIRPDARLFHLLKTGGKEAARRYWMANGGITRRTHLLHKLGAGLADPLEADETIPLDEDNVLQVEDSFSAQAAGTAAISGSAGLSEELKSLVSQAVSSGIEEGLARGLQEALKVALTALRQNAATRTNQNGGQTSNSSGGGHDK